MEMDGARVEVGNSVYDVVYGPGVVQQLLPADRFAVRFFTAGSVKSFTYSGAGVSMRFPARTLYWHNPVVATPTKDERRWVSLQAAMKALRDALAMEL